MSRCVRVEVKNHKSYTDLFIMDTMIKQLKKKSSKENLFNEFKRNRDFDKKKNHKKRLHLKRLSKEKKIQERLNNDRL